MTDDFRFRTLEDELTGDPRTCRNCACVYLIERPKLQPPGMTAKEYDAMPPEQWVCRLNPPMIANTPKGPALVQMPTNPASVCWHWVPEGTLPGDKRPSNPGLAYPSGSGGTK